MPEVRLIDANAAADKIMREIETHADEIGIGATAILIAFARALRDETDFPTIEAEPVRHGRWISLEVWFNKSILKCSVCGNTLNMDGVNAGRGDANFCPNCGARMDGGADD